MKNGLLCLCLGFLAMAWFGGMAHAQNLSDFYLFPEVPYEATTYEHDDLIDAAKRSDGRTQSESLEACRQLVEDASVPFEIRRWAQRRRIELLSSTYRESLAIQEGREWLANHPDDPEALPLRFVLLRTACQRLHNDFSPELSLVRSLLTDLLQHHGPNNMLAVRARVEYANKLLHFDLLGEPSAQMERRVHLEAARDSAMMLAGDEEATTEERAAAASYLENTILPTLAPPPRREPEILTGQEAEERVRAAVEQIMEELGITEEEMIERFGPR